MERYSASDAIRAAFSVDTEQLWQRIMSMSNIGARSDGGVYRPALGNDDLVARQRLIEWATGHNYLVSIDAAANLWIRRAGTDPDADPVISGSHIDAPAATGIFNGTLGVIGALQALVTLDSLDIRTRRPIDVVAWTNQYGSSSVFSTGSSVWSGASPLKNYANNVDDEGIRFSDAIDTALMSFADLPVKPDIWPAYCAVELHIEEGSILNTAQVPIGAVTSIQGRRCYEIDIYGESARTGSTAYGDQRDALQAANRIMTALNELMKNDKSTARFSISNFVAEPASQGVTANHVNFTIDLHHPNSVQLRQRSDRMESTIRELASPCDVEIRENANFDPILFADEIVNRVERTASKLGIESRRVPSSVFHSSGFTARACPSGMIFVPSKSGEPDNPYHWSTAEQCRIGTQVLTSVLIDAAS